LVGTPDYLQQILGGIHAFPHILVEGDEKENAVARGRLHLANQFLQGEVIQKFDLHVLGQVRHMGSHLVGDGHAGQALIPDDHQPLLARMKAHGHGDVLQNIEFFQDSGHAVPHGHCFRNHVVHSAENDGNIGKSSLAC
jgi:hypothetical protein